MSQVKRAYLYGVMVIALLVVGYGLTDVLDTTLRVFVFTEANKTSSIGYSSETPEARKVREERDQEAEKIHRQRNLSWDISAILVAGAAYLLHLRWANRYEKCAEAS